MCFAYLNFLAILARKCGRSIVPLPTDLHVDCEQRASLKNVALDVYGMVVVPASTQCWVAKQSRQEVGSA